MNITLLENHWYDATFSPSARFGGDEHEHEDHEGAMTATHEHGDHEGRTARRFAMVGVVPMVVAGIAVGVVATRRAQARRAARADELRQVQVDAIEYANAIDE